MVGTAAVEPEVAGHIDDAAGEVVMPDTVDEHAGSERIVRVGRPFGGVRGAPLGIAGIGREAEVVRQPVVPIAISPIGKTRSRAWRWSPRARTNVVAGCRGTMTCGTPSKLAWDG